MGGFTEQDKAIEAAEAAQAKADRDVVFEQRREQEWVDGDELGPLADPSSQDLMKALGHWTDWDYGTFQNNNGAHKIEREMEGASDQNVQQRLAVNELHNHYMVQNPGDLTKDKLVPEDTQLDLSSADSRVKALDNLVQNKVGDPYGERTCGAASLVGAGLLSGGGKNGGDGLKTVMDAMVANAKGDPALLKYLEGDKNDPDNKTGVLGDIRKRAADGSATVADMQTLQRELYNQLQNKESKEASDAYNKVMADPAATDAQKEAAAKKMQDASADGLGADTLQKFMHSTPEMDKMMKTNGMGISFIGNDPNNPKSQHAVLTIANGQGGPGAIYDPQLRDDGQMVMDPKELENYGKAQVASVQ